MEVLRTLNLQKFRARIYGYESIAKLTLVLGNCTRKSSKTHRSSGRVHEKVLSPPPYPSPNPGTLQSVGYRIPHFPGLECQFCLTRKCLVRVRDGAPVHVCSSIQTNNAVYQVYIWSVIDSKSVHGCSCCYSTVPRWPGIMITRYVQFRCYSSTAVDFKRYYMIIASRVVCDVVPPQKKHT